MENASKALIIAGAILLAIVIISLGLVVVNNVRNVTDNTNLSEQEIQSFNAKFIAYEGKNVSGSRVNSLIQLVIATNQNLVNQGGGQYVSMDFLPSDQSSEYYGFSFDGTNYKVKKTAAGNAADQGRVLPDFKDGKEDYSSWSDNTHNMSVKTGVNYTVELYYKNGLVKCIVIY